MRALEGKQMQIFQTRTRHYFVEQDVRKILSVLQHAQLLVNCHHNSLPE